jgi:hypothetical protein
MLFREIIDDYSENPAKSIGPHALCWTKCSICNVNPLMASGHDLSHLI